MSELETRVTILEAEMRTLKSLLPLSHSNSLPWWEKISGTFEDSDAFEKAMELGNQYRKSNYPNSMEEE